MPEPGAPPQYQRAVTPTIDLAGDNSTLRSVPIGSRGRLTSNVRRITSNFQSSKTSYNPRLVSSSGKSSAGQGVPSRNVAVGFVGGGSGNESASGIGMEMNITGRSAVGPSSRGVLSSGEVGRTVLKSAEGLLNHAHSHQGQKYDIIPLSDDVPPDGVMFARVRNQPEILVVFRTPEERSRYVAPCKLDTFVMYINIDINPISNPNFDFNPTEIQKD
jgi:hypothetical protein